MHKTHGLLATVVAVGLLIALTPQFASADSILTYIGNPYTGIGDSPLIAGSYDTTMYVSAEIDLQFALAGNCSSCIVTPAKFSLNDGRFSVTDSTVGASSHFEFWTDSSGNITMWNVSAFVLAGGDLQPSIQTYFVNNTYNDAGQYSTSHFQNNDFGANNTSHGTWSIQNASVPEPTSVTLVAIGLTCLGIRLRKRIS
jgi:hypothetical protein